MSPHNYSHNSHKPYRALIYLCALTTTHIIHINHTELLFMSPHNYSHNSHKSYRALIYEPSQLLT